MTPRWEHREGRVWRFFTAEEHYRRNLAHMRIGDATMHLARCHGSAVLAQGCDGIRIENVVVHAAPGLAIGLVGNRGEIAVRGLEVRFAPGTNRLLTTDADGVHCQQNRSGPVIEDCFFEGMADDAINLYAPPNVLREIRSPTQWLVSPGCLVFPNDRLQVLDPKMGRLRGEVRAVDVKVERRAFLLTLDKPLAGAVAGADHRSADTLYMQASSPTGIITMPTIRCRAGWWFRVSPSSVHGNSRISVPRQGIFLSSSWRPKSERITTIRFWSIARSLWPDFLRNADQLFSGVAWLTSSSTTIRNLFSVQSVVRVDRHEVLVSGREPA